MFSALPSTSGVFLDWIFFRSEGRFSASNRDEFNTRRDHLYVKYRIQDVLNVVTVGCL
jgi:hypothetical protein